MQLEPLDLSYNERLVHTLIGRQLREDAMPQAHRGLPMFSFWGEELGFSGGDVHAQRAYRIYLSYNEARVITDARVVVEGELISPCSGYFPEALDEFDYQTVLDWCMDHTRSAQERRTTMKRTLSVVDMQNDFIDGSLGTPEAQKIVPAVQAKIQTYRDRGDEIIFTRDTHGADYLSTPEGKKLPVEHCIQGTAGWELAPGLWQPGEKIINKPTFGYTGWSDMEFDQVELVGLCTDICVVSNALILKALFPEAEISVDPDCCAGVTPESHEAALLTMKMCQIDLVSH